MLGLPVKAQGAQTNRETRQLVYSQMTPITPTQMPPLIMHTLLDLAWHGDYFD